MSSSEPQGHTDSDIAVRFPDGVELTFAMLRQGIHTTRVPMLVDSWVHDDAQDVIEDAFLTIGDDPVDGWQAPHNLIKNHHLLSKPWMDLSTDVPAIVCGSGPSLDEMIPKIKELQGKALIVCAHSTLDPLVSAGIVPDVCTPIERIGDVGHISVDVPRETWYGGLPIIPKEADRFAKHMLVTGPNPVYTWAGISRDNFAGGSISGVMAAAVSCVLTKGPIYLVGCDMAGTHYKGYRHDEVSMPYEIDCIDGSKRPTSLIWLRNRNEYSRMTSIRRVIQTSPFGAKVPDAEHGPLPDASTMAPFRFDVKGDADPDREKVLIARAKSLRRDWDKIIAKVEEAKDMADIHIESISKDHATIVAEVLHSIYGQMSIEKRLGHKSAIIPWFKEASLSVLRGLRGMVMEATNDL